MRLYLDDERTTPDGWVGVKTYTECVAVLASGVVTHISLDHDLGNPTDGKNGYDVACWIERECHTNPHFRLPMLMVHTQNPVGRENICRVLKPLKEKYS